MAKQGVIYKISSPTGRVYIGQSININARFRKYKNMDCEAQTRLYNSFKKYGVHNHSFNIIEYCTKANINIRERYYQEKYNVLSNDKGLNCKYTKTNKKKEKVSIETRDKMSQAKKGKKLSEVTKHKMSIARKNFKHSEKSKQKMRGKLFTKKTREKLSQKNWKRKIVLDTNTGVFYNSATELSKLIGVKRTTLQARLSGQNNNNTQYIYT